MVTEKVWFITGTSSGLGRALAEAALRRGDFVAAAARNREQLEEVVAFAPGRALAVPLDVTKPEQIAAGVQAALERFGHLDVIVNNAGCGVVGALEELSEEQIAHNLDVNFWGPTRIIRAVLPHLRSRRSGWIVNVSAITAVAAEPGFAAYGASKAALEGMSEALRVELAPLGIHVSVVEPGPFRTQFLHHSVDRAPGRITDYEGTSGKFAAQLNQIDGKQNGDPAGAARAILALADSDHPPFRLPLGRYATSRVRQKLEQMGRELEEWEAVSVNTDFRRARAA